MYAKDKAEMNKEEHWLTTLILNIKINSMPYILKCIFFIGIVTITYVFSNDFVSKVLSIITYVAGICIDVYFLNKQCSTESKNLEVFIFIHMILIWAGTVFLIVLLIVSAMKTGFVDSIYCCIFDVFVYLFVMYATITPLLEAIINSNANQLTNKIEVKL